MQSPQVGFLVATADVDVPLLLESFDLGPYDGFLDPDTYERLEESAQSQAAAAAAAAGGEEEGEVATAARARAALAAGAQAALAGGGPAGARRPAERHRLLAVTMLCVEEAWEAAAADLLWAAFEALPGKVRFSLLMCTNRHLCPSLCIQPRTM